MYDVSKYRCSSAGGVATFDMVLGLIERYNGRGLALRVSEILTYRPTEFHGPQQRMLAETSLMRLDHNLGRAVDLMLTNLREPVSIGEIAERLQVPQWTLVRLFKRHLKQTPSEYYRHLRLTQARHLIQNSNYQLSDIGILCGFENPETFSRAFKKKFGSCASQHRSDDTHQVKALAG